MQYYGDVLRKLTKSSTTDICEFFVKKCLMNAKNHSANENMKRFFMICGVSANDGIKELLEKNELVFDGYWSYRRYFAKVKNGIPVVVKTYLSCMLLVLSSQKSLIFQKTGLNEQTLLDLWCRIFIYEDGDKEYFNRLMALAGQGETGVCQVFTELNGVCHAYLNGGEETNIPCNDANRDLLTYRIGEDAYVLAQRLQEMPDI